PTQKPIALYERIIQASSNPGDWVLDPFCGCATTPVAAEILGRKWIGMDLWERSLGILAYRFRKQAIKISQGDDILRQFLAELKTARTKSPGESKMIDDVQAVLDQDPLPGTERGEITFATEPPLRSADRARTPPVLRTPEGKVSEPRQSREEMFLSLIQKDGMVCRGCDREFDDRLYLELDHMLPKSDGGTNAIENRALLCGPCNRIKSNKLTLTGLRAQNRKLRRMAGQS
ncbi:MAG: DNA methyltransferase, partial [Deltaproteobacteria bacterium]|nr:DNA methyltransferase [Deltaproteobacteria bacterium]